ncbi:hypothetical protein GRI43_10095 [Altererythrobacter luteolus]|uniref:Uncharacterized protein n=1 Tax=Pontixanthobacter luteolus TaxID=295089 RepID=A0A6I4V740_9SPHN|nr:hypothetical protein [Pontixanthobacter luteolus]MXP47732.1 hypothetical protein [Pontixanthobacter luteolus]
MPESTPYIRHPAKFVPLTAIATGESGSAAVPISNANPLPCAEKPLAAVRALIPGTNVAPGSVVLIDCSIDGTVVLELVDGSQLPLSFSAGVTMLPLAVRSIAEAGTTASFNAWVLD